MSTSLTSDEMDALRYAERNHGCNFVTSLEGEPHNVTIHDLTRRGYFVDGGPSASGRWRVLTSLGWAALGQLGWLQRVGAMTQAQPAPPLAPCPFGCKGEISVPEVDTGYFRGHCHACGALGPTGYSREDGARLWNRRPAPATRRCYGPGWQEDVT